MFKSLKDRRVQLGIICIICLVILGGQLAYLTVERGDELYAESLVKKRVELNLKGTRGNIVDRYGIPIATNQQIYTVQLDRQILPVEHEKINQVIGDMLEIIYKNGDEETLINSAPIIFDESNGSYHYIWEDEDQATQEKLYKRWSSDIGVKEYMDPDAMVKYLREERYEIPKEIPEYMGLGIISVRLNMFMKRYTQYEPVPVAEDISSETVVQLETFSPEMPGVQTIVDSGRYYPMGETFAQITGYLGSIDEDQSTIYKGLGYDISSDKIGQVGVEAYGEKWLTGNKGENLGKLVAEKDSYGRIIKVLEKVSPKNGNELVLTIDSQLQRSILNILKEEIEKMSNGLPPYTERNMAPLAEEGAAVVLDVKTGEILALVSHPSYDPNSPDKEGKQYSLAYQGSIIPGSVFKMLIGIAGLSEGAIGLDERIYDRVRYDKYDTRNPPRCNRSSGHGWENYVDALKHSCNYYFYEVADRLGVDNISKWAKLFGLDGGTGIEILSPERDKNIIPSREVKIESGRNSMRRDILKIMRRYGYFEKELTDKQSQDIDVLVDFPLSEDRSREAGLKEVRELSNMLEGMGYVENSNSMADEIRRDVLTPYKRWTPSDTIMAGIGQGYTAISPLAMARYVAAIANGGRVLQTNIVKGMVDTEGNMIKETEPVVLRELDIKEEYLNATKEGMWRVVNDPHPSRGENDGGGTAASHFMDIDSAITVAGKTGTAQTDNTDETKNNAWFVAFTPYEEPEIAVVVVIPNGRTSGNAAPVARRIIEEYYRLGGQRKNDEIPILGWVQP